MPLPEPYRLTPVDAERREDVLRLDAWAFPTERSIEALRELPSPLSWDRAYGVSRLDDDEMLAGFHGAYPLRAYPVPGVDGVVVAGGGGGELDLLTRDVCHGHIVTPV